MSTLDEIVKQLPQGPGVYQFYNSVGEILYVGKARSLRKRVQSYFGNKDQTFKTTTLVSKIAEIRYVLVETESDALLLENNLIKEYQPKYNILLKDDKTYPWICIKKERFPRVMATRHYITDGSAYFGPYTSGFMVKTLLELIRQLYKLRTCKLMLSEAHISKNKYKRCLEFQLGNCKAPCEGLQSEDEYNESIREIREILKGNLNTVIIHLEEMMKDYAFKMQFEEAEIVKNKIAILEKFRSKSTIVNPKLSDVDVFSMMDDEDGTFVNFLKVVQGAVVQAHNVEIVKRTEENQDEIFISVIYNLRKRFSSEATEIIVPFKPALEIDQVHFTVPKIGDKLKLLDLSKRNLLAYKSDLATKRNSDKKFDKEEKALLQLKQDLKLKVFPAHIECFDNSNIQGTDPVASCVVFVNGRPQKSLYRHFNVKTVDGPNDFASMEEIVYRRYRRILDEQGRIPDLVIIDGGKGQLHAAVKSLQELGLYGSVSIIGIAKRLEEIYTPEDPIPLYINKNSVSLRLIQRVRDEAHRFGITFHRRKRSIAQISTIFSEIPGIGGKTMEKILRKESDIQKLGKMSLNELTDLAGKRGGKALYDYFQKSGR